MASNFQPGHEKDSQLLNSNMENISNELSSMLIGGDLDTIGMIMASGNSMSILKEECAFPQCNNDYEKYAINYGRIDVASTASLESTTLLSDNNTDLFYLYQQYYQQCLYIQHQEQMQQGQQNLEPQQQFNIVPTQFTPGIPTNSNSVAHLLPPTSHGLSTNINNSYTSVPPLFKQIKRNAGPNDGGVSASTSKKLTPSPKFEFHFLRPQNNLYPDSNSEPLISSASLIEIESEYSSGTSRRSNLISRSSFSGHGHRKFSKYNDYSKEDDIDYDKITVDLSVLGLSIENKEHNPVLRLFGLFRKMHYYLNDVLPSNSALNQKEISISNLEANAQARGTMPCTMNVQYQVKYAARKCTNFLCDIQRLLNVNKMYSIELYLECEKSLNILRSILTEFEAFKRVDMEHKRGQFITEEVQVHTQKLEELLLQLNDQIRELQIYVHAFIWAVECSQQNLTFSASMNEHGMVNGNEYLVNSKPAEPLISSSHDNVIFGINTINSILEQQSNTFTGTCDRSLGEKETEIERQVTRYIG